MKRNVIHLQPILADRVIEAHLDPTYEDRADAAKVNLHLPRMDAGYHDERMVVQDAMRCALLDHFMRLDHLRSVLKPEFIITVPFDRLFQ